MAAAIRWAGVSVRYGTLEAVRSLDLEVAEGETFALLGPSGCGKTTLLKTANRLVEPATGTVEVLGRDVRAADPAELRRGIGWVIQHVGLFPHQDVRANVGCVPRLSGWDEARIRRRVDEVLELVDLAPAEFGARRPHELSGGQQQRVGVARALAADPPIVLMDEPFGALDPITRERLQDEFAALARRLGKTFVLVTHDVTEAARLADRVAVMRAGRVVQVATPRELVRHPADEGVAGLLGRHRYQLRLMTTRLSELPSAPGKPGNRGKLGEPGAPARADALSLPADASTWDALEALEAAGATHVAIAGGPCLARAALVAAAEAGG